MTAREQFPKVTPAIQALRDDCLQHQADNLLLWHLVDLHDPMCDLIDAQQATIDRLRTWPGIMSLLDEFYPADVFDGSSGDPGPTIVALTREIDRLTVEQVDPGMLLHLWSVAHNAFAFHYGGDKHRAHFEHAVEIYADYSEAYWAARPDETARRVASDGGDL